MKTLKKEIIIHTTPGKAFQYMDDLSSLFAGFYCRWCLNNMLSDSKTALEKNIQNMPEAPLQRT